jgi:hypothetical protein
MFENLDLNLREVAEADLKEMIKDCERELRQRADRARDNAMRNIVDAIHFYVEEYGSLEICRQEDDDEVGIIIHRCDLMIGMPGLLTVALGA